MGYVGVGFKLMNPSKGERKGGKRNSREELLTDRKSPTTIQRLGMEMLLPLLS